MPSPTEIGAYEAKTRLPEVLRQVQAGSCFTITQRGKPVADLVPAGAMARQSMAGAAERMLSFMRSQPPVAGVDIKALIGEDRD